MPKKTKQNKKAKKKQYAYQGELHLLSELQGVVGVLDLLHVSTHLLVRRLVDAVPVDNAGLDLVEELDEDESVTEILVEVVDERVDSEGVHPVAVGLLLAVLLDDLDLNGLQGGAGVEHVGNEGKVELGVTLGNITGTHELAAVDLLGLVKHLVGTLGVVRDAEGGGVDTGTLGSDLIDQDGVGLGVLDVLSEVVDAEGGTSLAELEVDPPEEDLLDGEGHELLEGLVSLKKAGKSWHVGEVDPGEQTNLRRI